MNDFLDLSKGRLVPGTDRDSSDFAVPLGASSSPDFAERTLGKRPPTAATPSGGQGLRLDANGKMPRRLTMLDLYIAGARINALPRSILNIVSGATAADNQSADSVDVTISSGNAVQISAGGLWLDVANLGDTAFSVAAGATSTITFPQANFDLATFDVSAAQDELHLLVDSAFHSSGLHNAQYLLSLSVLWEDANFARAAWIEVPTSQSTTVNGAQAFDYHVRTPSNCFTVSNPTGLGVLWCKDEAFALPKSAPLTIKAKVQNGDVIARTVKAAYLTGYCFYYET